MIEKMERAQVFAGSKMPRPTILIASTCWWPFPARLAMAFAAAGHRVEAVCPAHHPLLKVKSVARWHKYNAIRPLAGLEAAITRSEAAIIIPCDDRSVFHLHELYKKLPAASPAARMIEQSLGSEKGYSVSEQRREFIDLAREEGLSAPEMLTVETPAELRAALEHVGLPAVMKVDGTWGGLGVQVIHSFEEAETAFQRFLRPLSLVKALKRLLINRDPFHFEPWFKGQAAKVNIQRFVDGRPANSAVLCWDGQVLANINVEVLRSRGVIGNSTIVKAIDSPQMLEASKRLARRMGLSGFHGFDFLIENGTGEAHLIEMNPRSTPLSHMSLGPGRDLVSALSAKLTGQLPSSAGLVIANQVIAYFPQAWLLDAKALALENAYHDVPWEEPDLVRELIKLPWPERSLFAQFVAFMRKNAESSAYQSYGPNVFGEVFKAARSLSRLD